MTGSILFEIEYTDNFERSFKKLRKNYGDTFPELVISILEELTDNPYPPKSRQEPLPSKTKLPEGWTFHKLEFKIAKGASGQIRLMYLVNETTYQVKVLWIYNHEQFDKRPPDKDIVRIFRDVLDL